MNREYIEHYSGHLNRNMHMLVYGWTGVPVIAFPCQDGMCDNWEAFNMPGVLSDYIDSGAIQLFVVDTVDTESWSDTNGDKGHRAWMQEMYVQYIVNEAVPYVRWKNGTGKLPIVTGFSLGANHALITFLRRPELFSGCCALSGCYDTAYFWGGWSNEILYQSSPLAFIPQMAWDHPYINLYNQKRLIVCVGQGAWEDEGIRTSRILKNQFDAKGIHAWVDFWGYDVNHDWPWWYKQIRYFMPYLLETANG